MDSEPQKVEGTKCEESSATSSRLFLGVRLVEKVLQKVKTRLREEQFEAMDASLEFAGHVCLVVAAGLGLVYGIVGAIKADQLSPLLMGIAWVLVLMVGQYIAAKLMSSTRSLIKASPSQFSTLDFLSCVSTVLILGGLVAVTSGVISAIKLEVWGLVWSGLAIFAVCELLAWLCLHPDVLNIAIVPDSSAGKEAIGVLTFTLKALLRLVPSMFGVGLIAGLLSLLGSLYSLFKGEASVMILDASGSMFILGGILLPLIGYIGFILNYLMLDVILAILKVPGKLDELKSNGG